MLEGERKKPGSGPIRSNIDCNEGMAGFLLNEQDENGMDTTVLIAGRSMFLTDCAKVGVE